MKYIYFFVIDPSKKKRRGGFTLASDITYILTLKNAIDFYFDF